MPKAMSFAAGNGLAFQPLQRDPSFQIFLLKNAVPGNTIQFTVSGEGSIPREGQQNGAGAAGGGAQRQTTSRARSGDPRWGAQARAAGVRLAVLLRRRGEAALSAGRAAGRVTSIM